MSGTFDLSYLGVMVDMAGCPNRCRHCWLGANKNGAFNPREFEEIARQFRDWKDEDGRGIAEISFFSWWREPDYRDDYRALWRLEQELSSPGQAMRFELLSSWRLARDPSYAHWAATLAPKACQITFFGLEESTDWAMRRKGAFRDQLLATERLLEAGIAPRWQLFITKRCLNELDAFVELMDGLELRRRCEAIGRKFEAFIGGISPEGNGYELESERLEEGDVERIPAELFARCGAVPSQCGTAEGALLRELLLDQNPPGTAPNFPCVAIDADWDAYPNIAEATAWWRLGNLRTDGVDKILTAYRDDAPPAMVANRTVPVAELARRYGDPNGKKLYMKDDLICRFLHQWGKDWLKREDANFSQP